MKNISHIPFSLIYIDISLGLQPLEILLLITFQYNFRESEDPCYLNVLNIYSCILHEIIENLSPWQHGPFAMTQFECSWTIGMAYVEDKGSPISLTDWETDLNLAL